MIIFHLVISSSLFNSLASIHAPNSTDLLLSPVIQTGLTSVSTPKMASQAILEPRYIPLLPKKFTVSAQVSQYLNFHIPATADISLGSFTKRYIM